MKDRYCEAMPIRPSMAPPPHHSLHRPSVHRRLGLLTTSAIAVLSLLPATPACAQAVSTATTPNDPARSQSSSSDQQNAADIVVTAERREKKAQDVPVALSTVTGQRLDDTGLRDPGQLRFLVPGLGAVSQSQTPSNVDFSIRGNGTNSFSNAVEYNVSTVLDDSRSTSRSVSSSLRPD